jgi:hypothetical protein
VSGVVPLCVRPDHPVGGDEVALGLGGGGCDVALGDEVDDRGVLRPLLDLLLGYAERRASLDRVGDPLVRVSISCWTSSARSPAMALI